MNEEVLDQENFDDDSITHESKLLWQQINEKIPSWFEIPI